MKYFFLFTFIISGLFLFVTCDDDGLDAYSYGNCETGDRRCTGTKLEVCTDYHEWTLLANCADSGGECIYEKGDYYCSEEIEETPDAIVEWEDEEVEDDAGPQLLDNFGSVSDESDEEQDDSTVEIDDENTTDTDIENDIDDSDSDEDSDIDDSDIVPVCGNGVIEGDEICEKNGVKDCTEIDSTKYTAGKAICDDTCMDYNTVTCVE